MKLNTKMTLLIAIDLVLTSVIICTLSVWQLNGTVEMVVVQGERLGKENIRKIRTEGKAEEQSFREELLLRKKDYLRSQVQTNMSIRLNRMILETRKGSGNLSSSSTKLATISQTMSLSADQTSDRANIVEAAAEEMNTSMGSLAAAMEQASINVRWPPRQRR